MKASQMEIPHNLVRGFEHLKSSAICSALGELQPKGFGLFAFRCEFEVAGDNAAGLPPTVKIDVWLSKEYPFGAIEVYAAPEEAQLRGFPHQDAESGKLCLPFKDDAPYDVTRLTVFAEWTKNWLADAGGGLLLAPGDPYELPDFSRKRVTSPLLASRFTLLIDENESTFDCWRERIGSWGTAEYSTGTNAGNRFITKFRTIEGNTIRDSEFAHLDAGYAKCRRQAVWVTIPNVVALRHRPAQNYAELKNLFHCAGTSLREVLKKAWSLGEGNTCPLLLVGFPIPKVVGGPMVQLHWQGIVLPAKRLSKSPPSAKSKRRLSANDAFAREWKEGAFCDNAPILWTPTENISKDRQFARGGHAASVRASRMSIIGCGALGAPIAESFARGGLTDLSLFDGQHLEYGNLCRHTLEGRDVGYNKAVALANRLQFSHPSSNIRGFDKSIPFLRINQEDKRPWQALLNSTAILDCSTDDGAFKWLSQFARERGIRLASAFIDANATTLTLVLSGKHSNANTVYRKLLADIRDSNDPGIPENYFTQSTEESLVLPVGCWHPTFPGLNYHIWLLAFAAISHIVQWINTPWGCDGYGILISRKDYEPVGPIVETVWNRPYR